MRPLSVRLWISVGSSPLRVLSFCPAVGISLGALRTPTGLRHAVSIFRGKAFARLRVPDVRDVDSRLSRWHSVPPLPLRTLLVSPTATASSTSNVPTPHSLAQLSCFESQTRALCIAHGLVTIPGLELSREAPGDCIVAVFRASLITDICSSSFRRDRC